jgi:hypothetical protein
MRKFTIIFTIAILLVCCIPASAQTISYNCPEGMAIYELQMIGNSPTTATFELHRQDGTTTSGSWSYQPYTVYGYAVATTASISLEGDSDTTTFVTPGQLYISLYPSRNLTELAETRLIMGAGQTGGMNNIAVEKYGITSPIIGFSISADNEITYSKTEESITVVSQNLKSAGLDEIMDLIYSTVFLVIDFVTSLLYWLKFFFVENLLMIVALFLAVPMAFAAKNSRGNPEKFLRQYFKTLKGFFEFILSVWQRLIDTIGTVRGWFRI